MRAFCGVLAFILVSGPGLGGKAIAAEDERWICVADSVTGFSYQNGKWASANFNVEGKRYIISKEQFGVNENDLRYHRTKIGEADVISCKKNSPDEYGFIVCSYHGILDFRININHLRYISIYSLGYIDGQDNNLNTPSIEIGTCSPL